LGKAKRTTAPGEVSQREKELSVNLVILDPFSKADRSRIKEIVKEEEEKEYYDFEKDNFAGMTKEDFDKLIYEREVRIEMNKRKESLEKQIASLQEYIDFLEEEYNTVEENYQQQVIGQKKASDRINKIRYNFETVVYLKQGQVEVPQLPVATDYKDAILIQQKAIDDENAKIIQRGDMKVDLLKKIS